ncbi:MFS transporter [Salipiger abyssi]|uniref:MFS transporter, ACS family, tartrate transporter n=1 Tax=Salipiger abyssi TaxID=1250539 RepID=A0A1P8UMY4_9RHOB|nr:MFS transporter [Salipiger abyssi]APZ50769.1 MFS transporter, ACS family, tartrate transporter [Salipiger abyssi]
MSSEKNQDIFYKISINLLPFFFMGQLIMNIDRSGISYAALPMRDSIGLTPEAFGLAAGIFFVGYALIEIPSNLLLEKIGATRWVSGLIVCWGLTTGCLAFVTDSTSLILLRFLMGVFEGGYTPAMLYLITLWVPQARRGRAYSLFLLSVPLAGLVGGPISGFLLGIEYGGFEGWQWLFIVEGVVTVCFGVYWAMGVPNAPQQAKWLTEHQKTALLEELELERRAQNSREHGTSSLLQALKTPPVWIYSLGLFAMGMGMLGILMWLPQLIQHGFPSLTSLENGILAGVPFAFAMCTLYILGWTQDKTGDRRWHLATLGLTSGAALLLSLLSPSSVVAYAALCIAVSCSFTFAALWWPSPTSVLSATAAAGGLALINGVGNLGGFVGPYVAGLFFEGGEDGFMRTTAFFGIVMMIAGMWPIIFSKLFPSARELEARKANLEGDTVLEDDVDMGLQVPGRN